MADLATEIANLNAQAAELLAKYNGAFDRLDEETQNKILEIQNKAQELQAQIESLGFKFDDNGILVKEDGSELSVGNALKLGGKSLEEILLSSKGIKQIKVINDNNIYSTSSASYVEAFQFSFDNPINTNSAVFIQIQGAMYREPIDNWASVLTIKRDGINLGIQLVGDEYLPDGDNYAVFRLGQHYQNAFSCSLIDYPNQENPVYSLQFADHSGGDNVVTYLGCMENNAYQFGTQIILLEIGG